MRLSSSTKVLSSLSLPEALQLIKQTGYDGAEIWVEQIWRQDIPPATLKKILGSLSLHATFHAPAGDLNITSSDEDIRAISVEKTIRSLELAAEVGVDYVTVHPGRKTSSKEPSTEIWQRQLDSVSKLAAAGQRLGVRVGVENMEQRALEVLIQHDHVRNLVAEIDSSLVGITFDIAHAATIPGADPVEYMVSLGTFDHVHVSDSLPPKTHVPLGEGHLDLARILAELGKTFQGYVAIEGYVPGRDREVLRGNYEFGRLHIRKRG